ncbi:Dehydrogenase/reductase SDR family member on chromosome X [Larimichthys crocea]|uniref:Uncharacterized protein n=1 Tax=Larimichthys crocea TaxID=215358 RepID=A0ACD3QFX1_LARCR|nr:Dehydrogenase/reductase SDR family member on chromosome X [Larimichthys crocea]
MNQICHPSGQVDSSINTVKHEQTTTRIQSDVVLQLSSDLVLFVSTTSHGTDVMQGVDYIFIICTGFLWEKARQGRKQGWRTSYWNVSYRRNGTYCTELLLLLLTPPPPHSSSSLLSPLHDRVAMFLSAVRSYLLPVIRLYLLGLKVLLVQLLRRAPALPVMPRQDGKVAIVTGGVRGIGYEVVRHMARLGAHVIIGGRNEQEGQAAVRRICEEYKEAKGVLLVNLEEEEDTAETAIRR